MYKLWVLKVVQKKIACPFPYERLWWIFSGRCNY